MLLETLKAWAAPSEQDASYTLLFISFLPVVVLAGVALGGWYLSFLGERNGKRRKALLKGMGIVEEEETVVEKSVGAVKKGKKKEATRQSNRRTIVGFWHPYCNAGGGGERVLWSAIAYLQATHPSTICLIYTGDYPAASKSEILDRVKIRFKLPIQASTVQFIPLPSRHMLDDGYFSRFTLLAQSLASVWVLLQGIGVTSKDGVWGDCFIDTMGYAFTFPGVRLLTSGKVAVAAYVHYPTISTDMLGRVVERKVGVENPVEMTGSSVKTLLKTVYYKAFIRIYALTLLFSSHTMTNSSWTQAHIVSLLSLAHSTFLGGLIAGDTKGKGKEGCEVVYPPCDTREFLGCGRLESRERVVISLSQFRPEKAQATQIRALAQLFADHPEHKGLEDPAMRVRLVVMGSSRGEKDEERVEGLRRLVTELALDDYVEFVVNASFPELVNYLGRGSVGINTMVDEHFGINIVEFMAAGLIPLVHASAGPKLDIVVPHNSRPTGYHGTDVASFAAALHTIFSLPVGEQLKIRQNARKLAVEKFSQEEFEKGFERGWKVIEGLVEKGREEEEGKKDEKKRK